MCLIRVLWLLGCLWLLTGCTQREPLYSQESYVFGTRVEVVIYGAPQARAHAAATAVLAIFDRLHHRLHAWEPGELDQLNAAFAAGRTVPVAPDLAAILRDATADSQRSGEVFNPAIGNLIRLWGFESDHFEARLPDPAAIRALVARQPRMSDIVIRNGQAYSTNPWVRVDLGGYAKGYALDRAAGILHKQGIRNALINIGGNILALGQHGDRAWRVGIQHPRKPGALATLDLHDGEAIGTSGDYQRYFMIGNVRYCHLIDPRSGYPMQGVQAVTILTRGPRAGVLSDADSKPLFISGTGGWRAAATRMGLSDAMLIDAQGVIHVTSSLNKRLEFADRSVHREVVP